MWFYFGLSQTGVWDDLESVSARFLAPLRQLLMETSTQCRHEMHLKCEEAAGPDDQGRSSSEPSVSVEIMNDGELPSPSLQDQIQVSCDYDYSGTPHKGHP